MNGTWRRRWLAVDLGDRRVGLALELATRTGHPAELVDERFTTATALRAIQEMDGSTRGRKGDVDAMAAAVMLRIALDRFAREEAMGIPTGGTGDA